MSSFVIGTSAVAQSAIEQAAGANDQLRQTAQYIKNVCRVLRDNRASLDTGGQNLLAHCGAAIGAANAVTDNNFSGPRTALDQITPQEIISQDAVISGAVQSQTSAVAARLNAMGRFAISGNTIAMLIHPIRLAENGSGDDTPSAAGSAIASQGRLQTFGTFTYSGGDQNSTQRESGFNIDFTSLTGGMDYRFTPALTAGVAVGYGRTKLGFDSNGGRLKTRALTISGYALIQPTDRFDMTVLLAYSRVRYGSTRTIAYTAGSDVVSGAALGRTHGDQYEASAGGFYNLGEGDWTFGPAGQVSASRLKIDAFNETSLGSAAGLGFSFPHQTASSLQFSLGFDVSRAISTGSGIISPYARVRGVIEALDKRRTIAIRYVNDRVSGFGQSLTTSATDRDRYVVGGGVAAQFSGGLSAFLDAQTLLGLRHVKQYTLSVGARYAF